MSHLSIWTLLLIGYFIGCDTRSVTRTKTPTVGAKNIGFFPSFAATHAGVPFHRVRRSTDGGLEADAKVAKESDVLNVDDFIARNGLDFGKGDEDIEKDQDVKTRAKRQEGEPKGNDLSWLLEQDAWEKVDDADLDWENINKEEFDGNAEALPRETRSTFYGRNIGGEGNGISEDAIDQKLQELTKGLRRVEEQFAEQDELGMWFSKDSVQSPPQDSFQDYRLDEGDNQIDGLVDSVVWRRRRSADNEVIDIEGRIEMTFEAKPENPTATVIIQKNSQQPPSPPEVPSPPIYFCGTKTDPNNPDSVSGEVSETVAGPPPPRKN